MKQIFTGFLFFTSGWVFSQKTFIGTIYSENGYALPYSQIYFPVKDEVVTADQYGSFTIQAEVGQKIKIISPGYQILLYTLAKDDEAQTIKIQLEKLPQDIEAVKIVYQPTGDLSKDIRHYNPPVKVQKMKSEISEYIAKRPYDKNMMPQPGEFVQPIGPGFSVGKVDDQWTDVDLFEFLQKNIEKSFFTTDLRISNPEIMPFIYFVFKDFDRKKILHYGVCDFSDIVRFQTKAFQLLPYYKSGLPFSKKMKKEWKTRR